MGVKKMKQFSNLTLSSFIFILTFYAVKTFGNGQECNCGNKPRPQSIFHRIIGGWGAEITEHPWMVQIELLTNYNKRFTCGGTLISKRHVISAAHCFIGKRPKDIRVMTGVHNTYQDPKSTNWINVIKIVNHPKFEHYTGKYDYSILTLQGKIVFSDTVSPACLPFDPKEQYEYREATVAGWGDTDTEGTSPPILQELVVEILDKRLCKYFPGNGELSFSGTMCAYSDLLGDQEISVGDSGGPLTVQENGKYTLVGIVSSYGSGELFSPTIFARITDQLGWIKRHTKGVFDSKCNVLS